VVQDSIKRREKQELHVIAAVGVYTSKGTTFKGRVPNVR
jgi:hypothetical protein